jgi:hypothetical protein
MAVVAHLLLLQLAFTAGGAGACPIADDGMAHAVASGADASGAGHGLHHAMHGPLMHAGAAQADARTTSARAPQAYEPASAPTHGNEAWLQSSVGPA